MPVEFLLEPTSTFCDTTCLVMMYDGADRRISKTRWVKSANSQDWEKDFVTHYTGIDTVIRENFTGPVAETKVVVNMPNGLGRYGIEDAVEVNANASKNFEWYLKNHLGSTMLVYGTVASTNPSEADVGEKIAAYDYRAFGEMVELTPPPTDKVTENFTGKEHDDEIALDYFGARYLDPMQGLWISVDPYREFYNSYAYGPANPVNGYDGDGNIWKTSYTFYTNIMGTVLRNGPSLVTSTSNKVERKAYGGSAEDFDNVAVRNIVQKWVYDPDAREEVNSKYPYGATRTIQQTLQDTDLAIKHFKEQYGVRDVLYDVGQEKSWDPTVFDETYMEFPGYPIQMPNTEKNNEPNGSVSIGDMGCDNCY